MPAAPIPITGTITTIMDEFFLRALLGGLGVAALAGPLGSFIVWRRMAFFGDTLAHSALLGVALGFVLGIDLTLGIFASCIAIALLLPVWQRQQKLPGDTLLGILSHTALSLGLVTIAFLSTLRVDLLGYLFGDILAVGWRDVAMIYAGGAVVMGLMVWLWRPLLSMTVHEEMARVEGVPVERVKLGFVLLLAITVAIAMKIIGMLLITSLLIIPAAAARSFARTPERMALYASLTGMLAVVLGLTASLRFDLPTGPAIVVAAASLFVLSLLIPAIRSGLPAKG
ncbi:iron chelate uptake ABC transporter family permease subunit [Oceanibaculum indicum]|uniref:High-affinity zinc uptake system membrane protein ZnuB n=1 Tax=Oceanibaculum indicum TaxID=526216 RepID=A0A420WQI0_9PROT|nr:iron chelate uptake ABC transporter family permease subunit [Oceanibaculum indicum]RKQ73297.1 zinc transport system permease protein [Oceanibaculum indicum]